MLNTTLIYIERDGEYLMLHRTKKENDLNHDKWIGVGGKCEEDESPEECARREAFEETGLSLGDLRYHGIVTFVSDEYEGEYMHLFSCEDWAVAAKAAVPISVTVAGIFTSPVMPERTNACEPILVRLAGRL